MANTLVEKKEYRQAEEVLSLIGPQSDYHAPSLILRAHILEKEKKVDEAIQLLQKALIAVPKRIDLYLFLASLHEQKNEFPESYKILKEGLEVDPENAELYFRLGALLDKMGKKKESLQQLKDGHRQRSLPRIRR